VGLFVVGTDTPEYISPSTAVLIQGRIQGGQHAAASFDVNTSCAGFVTSLDVAARMLGSTPHLRYAVVVGVYNMPRYVREGDAFGYSIFADGAGAVLLERVDGPDTSTPGDHAARASEYTDSEFVTDGTQWDFVGVYAGGTRTPVTHELLEAGTYGLENLKRLPGDRNIKLWPPLVRSLMSRNGLRESDVDHIIFTQINRSVITEVMSILELPMEKTTTIMDRYGYTGSGCVPMAFYHAVKEGRVQRGDRVVLVASGAGLSVGANLLTY
jgi:3-oxoacyl-[acyl-carrier-protein] synthase-3